MTTTLLLEGVPVPLSRVGFGGCPMGQHGWGATDEDELIAAAREAVDLGITLFDTADIYGLGRSEELLGRALRHQRDEVVIATKFGVRRADDGRTYYDLSPDWMRRAVESSLRRLGTEWIDVYQVHYDDGRTPPDIVVSALEDLRREGKILRWGVSNIDLKDWQAAVGPCATASFELSAAERTHEPAVRRHVNQYRMPVLSWGSLGQGMLTGKYREATEVDPSDRRRREEYEAFHAGRTRALAVLAGLERVRPADATLAQTAIRWILDAIPGTIALVGIKRPSQIRDAAAALSWTLTDHDVEAVSALGNGPR